jgi:multiple sugar transport system substrate-binding protein
MTAIGEVASEMLLAPFAKRVAIVACVIALLALTGCDRASASRGDEVVEIRFWNGFTGPDGRTMLGVIKQFNEANQDVHVTMQRMPWATYYNKLFVAGLGGRAPEVFVSHRSALQRFVAGGFVRPADELLGGGADQIDPADIDANILEAVQTGEKHWAIPLDVHPLGMFYNRALLKRAEFVDATGDAKPPTTLAEFQDVLARLKPQSKAKGSTYGFAFTWQRTNCYTIMRQDGGELLSPDLARSTFASPANVEALGWCAGLIRDGLVPNPQDFEAWIGFRQGRVGIVFEGIYMLPDLQRQKDLDWAAAPLPVLGKSPAAWADSHSMCLRKDLDEKHLAASKRLIKYLSDHSLDWAVGGQVPVRKSLRNSDRFRAMTAQSEFAKQIPYVAYFPPTSFIFEYQRAFDDAVELALRGTKSSDAALKSADEIVDGVIARYRDQGISGAGADVSDAGAKTQATTTAPTRSLSGGAR